MTSNSGEARTESNRESFPDGDEFPEEEHYFFLQRPESITEFLKTWFLHGQGKVDTNVSSLRVNSLYRLYEQRQERTWRNRLSQGILNVLWVMQPLLAFLGTWVEFPGNVWRANGGSLCEVTKRLLTFSIVVPGKESAEYHSLISQLDPRRTLWVDKSAAGTPSSKAATSTTFPGTDAGARSTADVLVMASKLAYENGAFIEKAVTTEWNMHFVEFVDGWNEFLKLKSTHAFMFTDKAKDANAIVVAWRGTEPFNAMNWSTDFDFSWYQLGRIGKVHVGFMEALGHGTRKDKRTFRNFQNKRNAKVGHSRSQFLSSSGLSQDVIDDKRKVLAYDSVTERVRELLGKHPRAKVYVTGHSLGGALASLYTGTLFFRAETDITNKLAAVYTFGQPRIGDVDLKHYLEANLKEKYFRVVYCNDVVPRIPFDDEMFGFKHFSPCFYYDSGYESKCLEEAPGKNFFYLSDMLTVRLTALGELYNACLTKDPEFVESWSSIFGRVMALFLPGVGGHSPVNYVNAVRRGPAPLVAKLTQEIQGIDTMLHKWEEKVRDFVYRLFFGQ